MPAAKIYVAEEKDKPVFDEQTLAKLLEAAYVLQEHNRELRQRELNLELQRDHLGVQERAASAESENSHSQTPSSTAKDDYTQTLAQIVETQRQIQARNLPLQAALDFVTTRVTEIAKAGGAATGILSGKSVLYRAVAGSMTLPAGSEVAMDKALCVASLRTGQVIRCADVNAEFLLDVEECQRRGIQSMIAVPVYHNGGIAGGIELYYATAQAFTEQDVHTCQLMAGLVTEALVREEEVAAQRSLAAQRAAMRETLEKLKPTVAAMVDRAGNKTAGAESAGSSEEAFSCGKCGHRLVGEEQFCGNCGTPRSGDYGPPSLQSKVASLWQMQEAMKKTAASSSPDTAKDTTEDAATDTAANFSSANAGSTPAEPVVTPMQVDAGASKTPAVPAAPGPSRIPVTIPGEDAAPALAPPADTSFSSPVFVSSAEEKETGDEENQPSGVDAAPQPATALAVPEQAWSSAAATRDYLEELAGNKHPSGVVQFLNARRGDVYLAVAVIVVAIVVCWGIWSSHPVSATGNTPAAAAHRQPDPNADLSWFDRMLINLGLAEAPAPPESKGNPDTQVWVDLHTALYYCPGTDLYGKTPKGKYTSQRDAQLDSFGPAAGRPCE
jgi:L-methionine (R)-S-oxide reductase